MTDGLLRQIERVQSDPHPDVSYANQRLLYHDSCSSRNVFVESSVTLSVKLSVIDTILQRENRLCQDVSATAN